MSARDQTFLTPEEAIRAIRADFTQYPPQTRLFLELSPMILGPEVPVIADPHQDSVWIAVPTRRKRRMRKISFRELGAYLCHTLEMVPPETSRLVRLCEYVFETPATAGKDQTDGRAGIWLETGMKNFECRQCGRCCRRLDYRFELTDADYQLWVDQGRTDILEWVGAFRRNGRIVTYAIWIELGTRRYAPICPWLKKIPGTDRWECSIHDVKPEVCREYPATRKHAQITGCGTFKT
ncbi:MAG: YkgJ family cysteine cluster protein [Desulfobacterales bacterium]|nr:YkgJ family cysteine cluster protein [Desulfobacterales bacterium]